MHAQCCLPCTLMLVGDLHSYSMSVSAINKHHSLHISSSAILLSIPGLLVGV